MVSVFWGVGGDASVDVRVVRRCGWFSYESVVYNCFGVSSGVVCLSPDSSQNCLRGAYYDLASPSQRVAWKSPPRRVVAEGYLDMISVCIYFRISMYSVSCDTIPM